MLEEDQDVPALSLGTLAALQDFYLERDKDLDAFEEIRTTTSHGAELKPLSMSMFKEDWNASQFWFTDETASYLARQVLLNATADTTIAIISAPSVFLQIRNLLLRGSGPTPAQLVLLEYDDRFEILHEFVKYDFNRSTDLPIAMRGAFDRILCDPPYHSKGCVTKYSQTLDWLAKDTAPTNAGSEQLNIVCTGETMEELVLEVFNGTSRKRFRPQHTVRLDNKYACFATSWLDDIGIGIAHPELQ